MNKYLSLKIKIISFIAIIMVVFLHCYNFQDNFLVSTTIITEGLNIATYIEYFLCNGLTRVAVPIFFMISGYLFFLTFKCSLSGYFSKIKSRFLSLAVPYIIWTLISIGICCLLWGVDIMPVNDMKANLESGGLLQVFLSPPNFQFWFIIQLIIYVIFSPVIYLLIKFKPTRIVYLLVLFCMWFMDNGIPSIGLISIVTEAIFFFSIGAYLAITNKKDMILKEKEKNTVIITTAIWILILAVKTFMCATFSPDADTKIILVLYKLSIPIGIFSTWFGLDHIIKNEKFTKKVLSLAPHTFFIFCFHEPLLDFVIQYSIYNISTSISFSLISYFVYPTITIILAIIVSKILMKYVPVIHNILTGSRGTRKIEIEK